MGFSVPTNIARGSFISSGDSLGLLLLRMAIAMTNITAKKATVIFVIGLFMIVPLCKGSGYPLFVFKVYRTHLISEQSIVAIMYDDGRAYFDIKFIKKAGQNIRRFYCGLKKHALS
jgi:hypothetical protein